jgi:hypothetical protein
VDWRKHVRRQINGFDLNMADSNGPQPEMRLVERYRRVDHDTIELAMT